jgi:hypothetical protein
MKSLFVRAVLLCVFAIAPLHGATDEAIIAEVKPRLAALQRKLLETEDSAERLEIQRELMATMDAMLPRLSPGGRAVMSVSLKVVQPIQLESAAYVKAVGEHFGANGTLFGPLATREQIGEQIEKLAVLSKMNDSLTNRINSLRADAERLLETSELSAIQRRGFLQGLEGDGVGKQMSATKAVRTLDTRFYATLTEALKHLDANWGKWSVADNGVVWKDAPSAETRFNEFLAEIQTLAQRQRDAQLALAERIN